MAVGANAERSAAPLSDDELKWMDAWWRAANYLSVGQIYLMDNPLLEQPLEPAHIKPRLLGHFGTVPGLTFIYVHLNRIIKARDLDVIYITGPGHGAHGNVAATPPRRRPAPSTRAASWATRSHTPTEPHLTTRSCSSPASSAMARLRPGRWRPRGTPTSS